MDGNRSRKTHKEWRRIAKKERRRRVRREAAVEREAEEEQLRAALERSADYLSWIERREAEEKKREEIEKAEHDEREKLWLEEEVKAQREWRLLQERKKRARQQQLEQEAKIREEFEAKQEAIRKKQEEEKRKRDEEIKRREQLLKEIDDYIDSGIKTPEALREVIDSQPGKELCPFFAKTGACRYGDTCSRNHRRVCLSKVILVPGFYTHFSLEKNSAEYDTDIALEFESSETRQHFREFYKDVVPELESFGRIKTLKYCCNTEVHLRGNLYVEYYTEREAARALRRLKGRWYAGRQLNCEFVNLKSWRSAVCGMSKCPKGRACNFLHTFKNPHDEYDIKSPPRWAKQSSASSQDVSSNRKSEHRSKSKCEDFSDAEDGKNWRWSESPEPEVEHRSRNEKRHRHSDDRQKSSRRHEQSDGETRAKHLRLSSKKHPEEKTKDENVSNGSRRSKKHQSKRDEDSHSDRRYTKSGRSHRSKSHRSSRYSTKNNEEQEKSKQRSNESYKDCSKRKDQEKSNVDETPIRTSRAKLKWDKENEQIDSESTGNSSDSDVSGTVEEKKIEASRCVKKVDDEWATTDSED